MPTIRVKENEPFEVALRRFKRTIEKSGLLTELRAREFYEKPNAERKRKKAAAVKRHYTRLRSMMLPKKLYNSLLPRPAEVFCWCLTPRYRSRMVMIKERIREDMKAAMRAHDADRLSTIRLLLAAVKQREIDEKIEATDAQVTEVIAKMVTQRRVSIQQYRAGGREDLAQKEQAEIAVLSGYLPKQLSDEEIGAIIDEAIAQSGLSGMAAMGKVMGAVKAKVAGRADLGKVSALVKARLTA